MIRVVPRYRADARYLMGDPALELDAVRGGPAAWWVRGGTDAPEVTDLEGLWHPSRRSPVVGVDLIVAAPRMASIILALHPDEQARALVAAHREAVTMLIGTIETWAWQDRFRAGDLDIEQPRPLGTVISFTHGVNRAGEPHLHDHVVLAVRREPDGHTVRWSALREHAQSLDRLYKSHLRARVPELGGPEMWRGFRGDDHVVGLNEGWRMVWPGRHDRGEPKRVWTRDEILAHWRRGIESFDHDVGELVAPRGRFDMQHAEHLWRENSRRGPLELRGILAAAHRWGVDSREWSPEMGMSEVNSYRDFRELVAPFREREIHERSLTIDRSW